MRAAFNIVCFLALLAAQLQAQDNVITNAGQALISGATNASGTNALFSNPAAIVADANGNLFVADSQNHAIRKISTNGIVSTFAGQLAVAGSTDGTGTQAQFDSPSGVALDKNGNLFVSDTGNHTIRKTTSAGVVTTIAGAVGQSGFTDATGTIAQFHSPLGLAVATNGTLYVADSGNHLIRSISPGGVVNTLAGLAETWGSADGTGTNARFNGPVGIALDQQGELFVSDANNHTIRKITSNGTVSTWAGVAGADGCVDEHRQLARFCKPAELALDAHGNLFVADSFNHVIRKISRNGNVTTISGLIGNSGSSDGVNGTARFFNPYGVAVRPDGILITTDAYNELIRVVFVPFQLTIQKMGGSNSTALSWDAVVGQRYQVQSMSALDSRAWTNIGSAVTATNLAFTMTDAPGSATTKIYRVLVVP